MNTYAPTTITFPGLGIEIDPPQSFAIGENFSIHLYALCIALGLLLAIFYGYKRAKEFGHNFDDMVDGILFIVPLAVICTRAYYCIFNWERYADNPIEVFYIWEGGLAIYGGVIGAVIGILIYSKWKKVKVGAVLDITSLGFLIGQTLGRWGNFFNREAFGSETENFLRMGLYQQVLENGDIVSSSTMYYYHPTFLYESLWNATGFVLLHFLSKKRKYDGQIALGYVAWYGLGRSFIEGLRTDSLYWGPFRVSQMLALVSFLVALGLLVYNMFRQHDPENMQVNITNARLAAAAEDEAVAVEAEPEAEVEEPAEDTQEDENG